MVPFAVPVAWRLTVAIERGAVDLRGAPAGEESAQRLESLLGFLRIARARRRVVGRELLGELVKAHVLQPHDGQALTRARKPIAEYALGRLAISGTGGLAQRSAVDVELRPPGGRDSAVAVLTRRAYDQNRPVIKSPLFLIDSTKTGKK